MISCRRADSSRQRAYAWNLKMLHNRIKSDRFYSKQFCNRMLTEILRTTLRKISREISKCITAEDLKEFIRWKKCAVEPYWWTAPTYPYAVPVMPRGETVPIQARKRHTRTLYTTVTSAKNNIIFWGEYQ